MKRVVLWLLGSALAIAIAFAIFCALNPLMGMIIVADITGAGYGHPRNPPALADGKDFAANLSDSAEKSRHWTQLLNQRFPTGTSVQLMLETLHQQRFEVSAERRTAFYDWGGMPCLYTLDVDWTEGVEHRITSIKGRSYSGCL